MKRSLRYLAAIAIIVSYAGAPLALVWAAAPPPTCTMQASPSVINVGGSITLYWNSTNATGGAITNVGNVGQSGSVNLLPPAASITTYVGSFTGPGGTANCQASVQLSSSGNGGTGSGTVGTASASAQVTPTATVAPNTSGSLPAASPNGGLVPCGYGLFTGNGADQTSSTGCQACNLAQLIQLIINFAIGISIPIAAGLFAWAGILYFTSGTNPGNIEKAKSIFSNALIGFLIAITAWLVINTLLHALLDGGHAGFTNGNWFTVQCDTGTRQVTGNIGQVLSSLPIISTAPTPVVSSPQSSYDSGSGAYACAAGYSLVNTGGLVSCDQYDSSGDLVDSQDALCASGGSVNADGQCTNSNGDVVLPGSSSGSSSGSRGVAQCTDDNPVCSISSLSSQGLTTAEANAMSCIAITENGGQVAGCSGTGPCGAFQISQTNWQAYAPANCSASAFGGNITAAQNNGSCNQQTMVAMVQKLGYQPWTGSNPGQAPWNPAAITCVNNYDPQ